MKLGWIAHLCRGVPILLDYNRLSTNDDVECLTLIAFFRIIPLLEYELAIEKVDRAHFVTQLLQLCIVERREYVHLSQYLSAWTQSVGM